MARPLPAGPFGVIHADPPWRYHAFSTKGEKRSAKRHYPVMTLDDICALPVRDAAAKDCHLFLWTTGPNLFQSQRVIGDWGFRFSAMAFVWIKLRPGADRLFLVPSRALSGKGGDFHIGMGHTTRKNAEFCLLGRRGSPKRISKGIFELIFAPVREHSRKPDEIYERIEAYAGGPYLDLFSRQTRPGWTAWGDEAGKFDGVAA